MSLDQAELGAVREVIRQEIRAAFEAHGGGVLGDAPLTYRQAAAFLGCHPNTIAAWRRRGLLPATGHGKMTRVLRGDLLLALERLKNPTVTETPAETAERILNTTKRGR